jgi:dihydroorotate dehydrogenase (NAD+) catalytic subunit
MTPDLTVHVGRLVLKNPVVCASGEHVLTGAGIRAGLAAGAAVVVAKSVNETQAARDQLSRTDYALVDAAWRREPWGSERWAEANLLCRSGLQPIATDEWIGTIAELDRHARSLDAFVAGSIILADLGEAVGIARRMADAGLRIIEFNVGAPYGDEAKGGIIVTERAADRIREQVHAVCSAVSIPVWVKLTGQSENVAALAAAARDGGAAAVIMIGRSLGMLPDLETMEPVLGTNLGYGGGWALPLACYWLARSRKQVGPGYPLVGTNGVRTGGDVLRMMLAGASAAELCTAIMTGGFGVIADALAEIERYLAEKGMNAYDLVGVAADRVSGFGEQPLRPDHWRAFVPSETIAD